MLAGLALSILFLSTPDQPGHVDAAPASKSPTWLDEEAPLLRNHIQLTSRDQFIKAGESYFDHQSPPRFIIFQAVEASADSANTAYAMYVAPLKYDDHGQIAGIDTPLLLSPPGSANTCGWFHPSRQGSVIFGSTLTPPANNEKSGFQVGSRKYVWMFPSEMNIVETSFEFDAVWPAKPAQSPTPLFELPNYDAECSYSKDGRFVLYAHVRDEPTRGRPDADIWVYDTQTKQHHELVHADGYDGGPFFSPDNKRICYRSDRVGNDLLQLFVADLKFDGEIPVGIEREVQVTSDQNVNWAPFWHPSGSFLLYGSSGVSHSNYEVFAVQTPSMDAPDADKNSSLRKRRITFAPGADVLPVFSDDGRYMMWTAQRGPMQANETKPSSQVWLATFDTSTTGGVGSLFDSAAPQPAESQSPSSERP